MYSCRILEVKNQWSWSLNITLRRPSWINHHLPTDLRPCLIAAIPALRQLWVTKSYHSALLFFLPYLFYTFSTTSYSIFCPFSYITRFPALPLGPRPFPSEMNLGTFFCFSSVLNSKSGLKLDSPLSICTARSFFTLLRYFSSPNSFNFQALMIS